MFYDEIFFHSLVQWKFHYDLEPEIYFPSRKLNIVFEKNGFISVVTAVEIVTLI